MPQETSLEAKQELVQSQRLMAATSQGPKQSQRKTQAEPAMNVAANRKTQAEPADNPSTGQKRARAEPIVRIRRICLLGQAPTITYERCRDNRYTDFGQQLERLTWPLKDDLATAVCADCGRLIVL